MLQSPPLPHYFSSVHEQFLAALRDFVAREVKALAARQLEF